MAVQEAESIYTLSGDPDARWVISCEHASNAIPEDYYQLGLPAAVFETHIALDIGAHSLAQGLRDRLGARLIAANYSRLLVDLNRFPDDPTAVVEESDGVVIPANRGLDAKTRADRIERFHVPYHAGLAQVLDTADSRNPRSAVLFVHSFTEVLDGYRRPWDVGILYHRTNPTVSRVIEYLQTQTKLSIGKNEPYTTEDPRSYSLYEHAVARDTPYLVFEVRQDLLRTEAAIETMADLLAPAVTAAFDAA